MIKRALQSSKLVSSLFKQSRSFSYVYNGLQWGQSYPLPSDSTTGPELSLDDVLGEYKGRKPKYLSEVHIPYNFKGLKPFQPLKRAYDNLILNEDKLSLTRVHKKLQGYTTQYLKAIASGNVADLPPCESNFIVAVNRGLHQLNNSGFKIELRESPHELKEKGLKEGVNIFETMHILGLNVERALNGRIEDYILDNQQEGRGLLVYRPKDREDTKLEEEVKRQERRRLRIQQGLSPEEEDAEEKNDFVGDLFDYPSLRGHIRLAPEGQMILRIYALITSNLKLVPILGGQEAVTLDDYTFRHIAVFENQLRMPPVGSMGDVERESVLAKYRLQEWKLVDFDGVLKGNPLLISKADSQKLYLIKQQ